MAKAIPGADLFGAVVDAGAEGALDLPRLLGLLRLLSALVQQMLIVQVEKQAGINIVVQCLGADCGVKAHPLQPDHCQRCRRRVLFPDDLLLDIGGKGKILPDF